MVPNLNGNESNSSSYLKSLKNFKVLKKLSDGRYSKVVLAETIQDKQQYAIKIIRQHDKPTISYQHYNSLAKINNEIKIMKSLKSYNHPNILKLFNVITNTKEIDNAYNQSKVYMILEYCGKGELSFKTIKGIDSCLEIFRSITTALEFLHANDIIHRDIKPSNILITETGQVKLSDFGISYKLTGDDTADQFQLSSTMGTPLFMAPELCYLKDSLMLPNQPKSKLDHKIDIWSLGVTFYWLVFQNFPYFSDNEFKLFNKIVNDPIDFKPMSSCPVFNNYTADELYSHGEKIIIFTKLCELLEKMLTKLPNKRPDVEQLKKMELITYGLSEKQKKAFSRANDSYLMPTSRESSFGSFESALNKLINKKKTLRPRPPPITLWDDQSWKRDGESTVADVAPFERQPSDEAISDLSGSSSSSTVPFSDDSEFVNSQSTHQLFAAFARPNGPDLNNSCFSLPLMENNRLTDMTMMSSDSIGNQFESLAPPAVSSNTKNASAPITPISPTYSSSISTGQIPTHLVDPAPKLKAVNFFSQKKPLAQAVAGVSSTQTGISRSKGAFNLSKITSSRNS